MIQTYLVDGMSTAACANKIRHAIMNVHNVKEAKVNHSSTIVEILAYRWVSFKDLENAVHASGNYTIQACNSLVGQ